MSGNSTRNVLPPEATETTVQTLQAILSDMTDIALQLKQAHWNVRGALFVAIHAQLDAFVDTARAAGDEIAERIVTLGVPADGLVQTVARHTRLKPVRTGFLATQEVVEEVSNRILVLIHGLREGIRVTAETDPVSQDVLIGVTAQWEKHLWMLQSQQL
jgi:starvation-inducible DNA-binding protein